MLFSKRSIVQHISRGKAIVSLTAQTNSRRLGGSINRNVMNKKRIVLISLSLLFLGGAVWFNAGSEPPIKIIGDLPANDLAEIKSMVRNQARRTIFPSFSWKNVKQIPTNIKHYSQFKFKSIERSSKGVVSVFVSLGKGPDSYEFESRYELSKGTTGWHIDSAAYTNWRPNR